MTRRRRWHEALDRLPPGPCKAAEIGVWRGTMSKELLRGHRDLVLYMIDPWKAGEPGTGWYDSGSEMARKSQAEVNRVKAQALDVVRFAGSRAIVIESDSLTAAATLPDGCLDLVFIDADHSYAGVRADIDAWLPKVRVGGWIGGHDYRSPRFPGVEQAVRERFGRVHHGMNATWFYHHRIAPAEVARA